MMSNSPNPSIPRLGAHTSISGGVFNAVYTGQEIGADVVQIFSKNQRQWRGRDYTTDELLQYSQAIRETGVYPVTIHDTYLINLAAPQSDIWQKSFDAFTDELRRAEILQVPYLVMHPGSHLGKGERWGIETIARSIRQAVETAETGDVIILLEGTAGQGTNLGYKFEHLRDIIDLTGFSGQMGVCLDTCHLLAAGYDIRTPEAWAKTLGEFDRIVGLSKLKALHLNDSQKGLGSRVDRHSRIGAGELGIETFRTIINDPLMTEIPMILEVPGGNQIYREDLVLLRSLFFHRFSQIS